ncbi:MAG: hypothetical protein EOP56_05715 [Sphingobacteriales bacterium]|nr:MAG: hypothetical protein EOP56_05715 [Sphingobacteriales bacterium]
MKWAYYVRNKFKAATVLAFILGLILCSIFWDRQRFTDLDHSVSSIYNDRLMPSTYIFQITDLLYQKRLLHEHAMQQGPNAAAESKKHDKAIAGLVKNFEATVLTQEERLQLLQFKSYLYAYTRLEGEAYNKVYRSDKVLEQQLVQTFDKTMHCLGALSKIQVGEGMHLTKDSRSIINGGVSMTNFEVALLIVLGLYSLILLTASDKVTFRGHQQQLWN